MNCKRHGGATRSRTRIPPEPSASTISGEMPEFTRRMKKYLKLIDLYKGHECLWHQCNSDFFNFSLKEKVWQEIARKMKKNSESERWKFLIYKLRYNVELERIHQQEAKFQPDIDLDPPLEYSQKFQFLNHMFDRKWGKSPLPTETTNSHRSACFLLLDSVRKNCSKVTSYASKLKDLENLRNNKCSKLSLTPEAFHRILVATSGSMPQFDKDCLEKRELTTYP
ncbi:uncharacterized protein LOC111075450 [Drosophila obscura]|uniref:uncharacterized protein LOC111075450 n=1 Tax=Drosophila obscura TaxID=7282 RepID=UPI001BB1D0AA|nr:uncharacterized protein LOC111075450 [Drosophila obscura]